MDEDSPVRRRLLSLANRDPKRRVDLRLLRRIVKALLEEMLEDADFELGICVVGAQEMTRLNEGFLHHRGVTDVIAFDYRASDPKVGRGKSSSRRAGPLRSYSLRVWGEVCVCLDEALVQARCFHTTWQSELIRYIVHGVLHLKGYTDQKASARRKMKREESRLLTELSMRFDLDALSLHSPSRPESKQHDGQRRKPVINPSGENNGGFN
jgi:probable rRNA maturation factor